jgi:ubiquinone/menaquinone biosynthesis C-methylase UbiE
MITEEGVRAIYDRFDYDKFTARLEDPIFAKMRASLLEHAPRTGEVLEVAIASGKNLVHYSRRVQVVGVDLSVNQLDIAKARAKRLNIAFKAHEGDAICTPFEANRFDAVVCTLSACTFHDPRAVFREMRRVCKPRGKLLFMEHIMPQGPKAGLLRAFLRGMNLFTSPLLGCDPTRDTPRGIEESGIHIALRTEALGGALVALVCEPLAK